MRLILIGMLAAVSAVGTAVPAFADTTPTLCETSNLAVTQEPHGVAAGTRYEDIVVTNNGATCVIAGYPGLTFRNAASRVLRTHLVPDTTAPLENVVLNTGDTARSKIGLADIPTDPDPSGPKTPATLTVTTPGSTSHVTVPWTFGDLEYPYNVLVAPFAVTDAA
jgi:hypothetical protein